MFSSPAFFIMQPPVGPDPLQGRRIFGADGRMLQELNRRKSSVCPGSRAHLLPLGKTSVRTRPSLRLSLFSAGGETRACAARVPVPEDAARRHAAGLPPVTSFQGSLRWYRPLFWDRVPYRRCRRRPWSGRGPWPLLFPTSRFWTWRCRRSTRGGPIRDAPR